MTAQDTILLQHVQEKPLGENELRVNVLGKNVDLPSMFTREDIEKAWSEILKKNPKAFNAPRFFLDTVEGNTLFLSDGTYADFVAAFDYKNKKGDLTDEERKEFYRTVYSILGVGVVLTTAEKGIILQKRAQTVLQSKGLYMVPSGGYMPSHFNAGEYPSPFKSAYVQLKDEQGVLGEQMKYVGISRDRPHAENPTLIFYVESALSIDTVAEKFLGAKDKKETDFLQFIPGDAEGLLKAMQGEYFDVKTQKQFSEAQIVGTGLGALMLYGNVKHGSQWLADACKEAKKRDVEVKIEKGYTPSFF